MLTWSTPTTRPPHAWTTGWPADWPPASARSLTLDLETGEVLGRYPYQVAADATVNEQTGQQYYRAHILVDREQLARLPDVFLAPGMPVEAHVQVGQRSFFRYLTQPIRDSFQRAFREQ